jgi:tRNA 2-selenouridine synthase
LVQEYGCLDKEFLVECTERIRKRVGTEQTKHAIAAIREGRMDDFIRLVLVYYDKTYRAALHARNTGRSVPIPIDDPDLAANARQILHISQSFSGEIFNISV